MKRVLIVEDDGVNMTLFRDVLHYGGYEVIEACNGLEAVEAAKRERPDLILMDIMIPEMDGVTAMKRIRELPELKDTPIIALTALVTDGEEGFDGVIPKPVELTVLLETVGRHLGCGLENLDDESP